MSAAARRFAGAALLVVLGIGAGAWVHSSRHAAISQLLIPVPAGETSGPEGAAPAEAALPPPKIPEQLPQFSLANRAGKTTSISVFAGKSLIINFWATWCAPCRKEIPLLKTLHEEWIGRGVSVVGIAVDYREKVLEFAERLKITYPLLIGEQDALDAAAAFGMVTPVFPFTVFTDRRGEVVALFVGELHRPQAELILAQVQNLNEDLVLLPAARHAIAEGLRSLARP